MKEKQMTDEKKPALLPAPTGYQILIALPEVKQEYESGIIKADSTKIVEEVSSVFGVVLKLGKEAYKDEKKFPNGPWCKEGDFIMMGAFRGTRFKIFDNEFRLLSDDDVLAVVEDPRGLSRA